MLLIIFVLNFPNLIKIIATITVGGNRPNAHRQEDNVRAYSSRTKTAKACPRVTPYTDKREGKTIGTNTSFKVIF